MFLPMVELVVLALAAYRLANVLAGPDTLLKEWHKWLDDWYTRTNGYWRDKLGELLLCPHCFGYWISLGMLCTWTTTWPWNLGWTGWITSLAIAGIQSFLAAVDTR